MLKINVNNLKIEIEKINKLLDEYENIFLNLYNELSSSSLFWNDKESKLFFENINIEKIKINNMLVELHEISNVYKSIIRKYEQIGNNIEIIFQSKEIILSKINKYLDKLYTIIEKYHELDLEFCPKEAYIIYNQLDELIKIGNDIISLKKKIQDKYNDVLEFERKIKLDISSIKIEYIKEIEVNDLYV